jgi:hypothetical protein
MHLSIRIDDMPHSQAVRWGRLGFTEAWKPAPVRPAIRAIANDLPNTSGHYKHLASIPLPSASLLTSDLVAPRQRALILL